MVKYLACLVVLSALLSVLFAAPSGSISTLPNTICQIYNDLSGILPPLCMLLVILAALVYAAGQVGGAELRANASKWATALIVGAVIGVVLILLLPSIMQTLGGGQYSCAIGGLGP